MRIVLNVESGEVAISVQPAGSTGMAGGGESGSSVRAVAGSRSVDAGPAPTSEAQGSGRAALPAVGRGMAAMTGVSQPPTALDAGPAPDLRRQAADKPGATSSGPSKTAARSRRAVADGGQDAGAAPINKSRASQSVKNGGKS